MTVEDKFDKEFGIGLYLFKGESFVIWLSKNQHVAYIDIVLMKKYMHDPTEVWFDFIFIEQPYDEGHVLLNNEFYRLDYIRKAITVLNPNKYNFVKADYRPTKETNHLLILKRNNEGIMISPAHKKYVDMKSIINFDEIIKKTATSVFTL